jgi:hypothetical protein
VSYDFIVQQADVDKLVNKQVTRIGLSCIQSNGNQLKAYVQWICTVKVEVTLRLTVGQSLWLGVEPTLGLVTGYYFLSEGCCLKLEVLSLWGALSDERTGLQFAVQLLNSPSRAEPVTILYSIPAMYLFRGRLFWIKREILYINGHSPNRTWTYYVYNSNELSNLLQFGSESNKLNYVDCISVCSDIEKVSPLYIRILERG